MPDYTTNVSIPYPTGDDPVRGSASDYLRTDLRDLAVGADAAIGAVSRVADEAHAASVPEVIPVGTDWNTLTEPSVWSAPAGGYNYSNTPYPDPVGALTVGDAKNSTGNIQTQTFTGTNPARSFVRDRNSAGFWQAWRELGVDDVSLTDSGAGRRVTVVDAGIKRRGGVVGTRGRAAVALRFDHHLAQFRDKVLPLLQQYRLPWGQMLNAGNVGSGNDTMTWPQIAAAAYSSGGEVWNHSWSHSNVTTAAQADREVTRGLNDLRTNLPGLWIDSWAGPGQPNLMGMEGSDTPERFYDTYPGRLVLAQHAFVRGYYPGIYQPLTGPNLVGAPHVTMDTLDAAYVSGVVRGAIGATAGLTLMLHPNYLDQPGYMTTADLDTILADIAARRDAEELVALSPAGILLADASKSPQTILATGQAGAVTSSWTETVSGRSAQSQYGVPHEAETVVRATSAGTLRLRVQITHPGGVIDQSHTVTATAGSVHRLGVPVTPPLSTTQTTITLNGAVTHTGIRYGAA